MESPIEKIFIKSFLAVFSFIGRFAVSKDTGTGEHLGIPDTFRAIA